MLNLILSIFASLALLLGLVSMVTPFPGATIMIAGGLTTLICTSPRARFCIRYMRTRLNWFNKTIFWLQTKVGTKISNIGNALKQTQPNEEEIKCYAREKVNHTILSKSLFSLTIIICIVGFLGGLSISYNNFMTINTCPKIGLLPACYLVTIGYALMFIATLYKNKMIFLMASMPVLALASFGSIMAILGHDTCPKTDTGIPMCYFSLIMVILVIASFFGWLKMLRGNNEKPI
jgi:hypothetical protein